MKVKEENNVYPTLQKGVLQCSRGHDLKTAPGGSPQTSSFLSFLIHVLLVIALQLLSPINTVLVKAVQCEFCYMIWLLPPLQTIGNVCHCSSRAFIVTHTESRKIHGSTAVSRRKVS